eukprot:CAMPEP_0119280556 /NCGR_PEP_ID=MMETSP1329-20130426/22893_1 /TAXON_ID=114041 /ORGANISM="Genus nov. species nov., Strain RCC1024" /LENGTH=181 /DNA_ID=CAMNT_0007281149 /DNA_START=107 /DNA_END=649 /DNA_ORIENTATION=-
MAFLATNQQPLSITCGIYSVLFRSYAASSHDHADRATHRVFSDEKEAVDVKMVWDASALANDGYTVLIVTGDQFGRTLASVQPASVLHATWESELAPFWRKVLGGHRSLKSWGEPWGIFKGREERGLARSAPSRGSWSRPLTVATSDDSAGRRGRSASRDPGQGGRRSSPDGREGRGRSER